MDAAVNMWVGFFIGVLVAGGLILGILSEQVASCRAEHNVADCKRVLIPATEER